MSEQWTAEDMEDLDPGIRSAVQALRAAGVETFESCQGGEGHAYFEPTVRFHGDAGAGWHALSVLISRDFPIGDLRRTWPYTYGAPTGPYWEVTFVEPPTGARLEPCPGCSTVAEAAR